MRNPHNEALTDKGWLKSGAAANAAPDVDARDSGRRCILTGGSAAREVLLRLALGPEGADGIAQVMPDALARAPGRGAWVGVTRQELEAAQAKGRLRPALARAFKTGQLAVPDDLPELAENALRRALLDRLGLEMRIGSLILGSDRIARAAREGKVAALYHASDASADGARKLDQAWRVGQGLEGSGLAGESLPLDRATLSVALGRDNVVHLALAERVSAERVAIPLRRLLTFLGPVQAGEAEAGE